MLTVDKALLVVELLMREQQPLSTHDRAERMGINRTSAHRLLNALMHRGWVERSEGTATYRLGS